MVEPNYLVCPSTQEQGFIAAGAIPMPCAGCEKTVWVPPHGLTFIARMQGCHVICSGCVAGKQVQLPTLGINPFGN